MLLILAVLSQPITYCVPFAEYSLCGETTCEIVDSISWGPGHRRYAIRLGGWAVWRDEVPACRTPGDL